MGMPTANDEQATYWNETAGPKWVALQATLDGQIGPLGRLAIERLAPRAGERVLDVGCGCGDSALDLARRVGPTGTVLGIDLSAVMLARARERAAAAGLAHVAFVQGDAQTYDVAETAFDAVFSRFGVMFFADPTAAFRNLRRALRPGGRLAFVCWQSLFDNPWMLEPLVAVSQHVPLPPPPAPDAPGPFSFADLGRVRRILDDAGFGDVHLEPRHETLVVGGGRTVDEAVEFLLQMGPTAIALRDVDPAVLPAVRASVRAALDRWAGPDGVRMPSASWIVTARR
jgi:SAM-dependent methyltransferase